jgi:hypothetical protein
MSTSVLGPQWKQAQPSYFQPVLSQEDDWSARQRQQYQNRAGMRKHPSAPSTEVNWPA